MRGLSKTLMLCALAAAFAVTPVGALRAEQGGGQGGAGGGGAQGAPARRSIADRTTGMQKLDGFYPLYWEEATGNLFLEIPKLGQEVLYVNGVGAGLGSNDIGIDRAQLSGTQLVKFERVGTKVFMVQPNLDYRGDGAPAAEKKSIADSFAESITWGFTVAAETDGRILVDLGDFLMRDTSNIGGRLGAYRFDRTRSAIYMSNTKAFPQNTEIEVTSTFITDGGGGGGRGGGGGGGAAGGPGIGGRIGDVAPSTSAVTVRQHHSFIQLPDGNYKPRLFDPRGGYFGVDYANYSAPINVDMRVRYINRHRLEKKDPNAAMSDPVKPITYYIDAGAPEAIKAALVEGAKWWTQAFEAAGFRNGFQVQIMPEGADPMDVRYNTVTWVHRSTRGWSYGSSIVDPRTGEIMKGHVSLGSLRERQDYLIGEGLTSPYTNGTEAADDVAKMAYQRIKQLSAHEIGHTLGLSHNYYGSKIGWQSVMDYPHPMANMRANGTIDLSQSYANNIGEWDKVAIRFGYGVFPAASEAAEMRKTLDDAWAKDIRFMTNQDIDLSPEVDQWNNGPDAAAELNRIMGVRRAGMEKFGETAIQKDRPMALIEDVLVPLYLHHRYAVEGAASALGGQNYIYALRGDGRNPVSWTPAAAQKAALDALLVTIKPSELALSRAVLSKLPPRPPGYGRTRELFPRYTGGAFDPLTPAMVASDLTIGFMLTNDRAARMVAQKAVDPSLPGLDDVLDRLVAAAFDVQASSAYETEIKRTVQNVLVDRMIDVAETAPMAQVRAIAVAKLKALQRRVSTAVPTATFADTANRQLIASDIQKFLDRPGEPSRRVNLPGAPPGAPIGDIPMQWLIADTDCGWISPRWIR